MSKTPAQIRAQVKYESKTYDKILLRLRRDGEMTREIIAQAADQAGESVNAYILNAVKQRMEGRAGE